MSVSKIKIAVLCGGPSSEYNVSLASGENVIKNLNPAFFKTKKIVIDRNGKSPIKFKDLTKFDLAFIAMHGPFGEDGTIQAIFEQLHVPYTGSGVSASILGMDKIASKNLFSAAGFNLAPFRVVVNQDELKEASSRFGFPLIVKPFNQGSSVGVSLVEVPAELGDAFSCAVAYGPVLAEKYIRGREIQAGILGGEPLPLVEIRPKRKFFDYEAKYDPALSEEITPAPLDKKTTTKIQEVALASFRLLGCRHFGRVDLFLSDEGEIIVSEINTIPGLTENSLFPKEARAAGIEFSELVDRIVRMALK